MLFGVGCVACKLDFWARKVEHDRPRGRGARCVDCGGQLQKLQDFQWVERMAAIRVLPGEPDALWA